MPGKNNQWSRPWELETASFEIADSLYYVGNKDVSCHVLKTDDGAILFDTAFAQTTYLLVDAIRAVGVAPPDIRKIVHTHGHEDHCGGTRRMKGLTGATVYLGERDIETVEKGTPLTCAEYMYGIPDFETFEVDQPIRHGDAIELGGRTIHCHATPGHTAGTMTFTFEANVDGTTLTAGMMGGPGLWTMLDEHTAAQGYEGNRDDFGRSMEYLADLDVDVWLGVHPGQSDTFEKKERLDDGEMPNPFVDPAGWRAFIGNMTKQYEKLVSLGRPRAAMGRRVTVE